MVWYKTKFEKKPLLTSRCRNFRRQSTHRSGKTETWQAMWNSEVSCQSLMVWLSEATECNTTESTSKSHSNCTWQPSGHRKNKTTTRDSLVPRNWSTGRGTVANCLPCQAATHTRATQEPLKMSPPTIWTMERSFSWLLWPIPNWWTRPCYHRWFSRFPEVDIIHSTSSNEVIPKLDATFARRGIPEVVKTDNGLPFSGEIFTSWFKIFGFHHSRVTPLWPRANGEAERFMRTIEKAVRTAMLDRGSWKQELFKFLRHCRATPHGTIGTSPEEMVYVRKIKTELPVAPMVQKKLQFADDSLERMRRSEDWMKRYMKDTADERNKAQETTLKNGGTELIRQEKKNKLSTPYNPLPYEVKSCKGSMVVARWGDHEVTRNSSFFKKTNKTCGLDHKKHYKNNHDDDDDLVLDDTPLKAEQAQTAEPRGAANNGNGPAGVLPPEPKLSHRVCRQPAHLNDFVC